MKKLFVRILVLAVVAAGAWGIYRLFQQLPQRAERVPTTVVRQSDIVVRTFSRGELQAVRSATLTAPNLFGTVQVMRLAPLGSLARTGDLIVQFDDAEVVGRVEQRQLEIDQAQQQIIQSKANLEIRTNQDAVELLQAKYAVRRAELEVKRNPILAAIDAKKNLLNLDETQRRLKELQSDIQSRREQALAELAVLQEKLRKAQVEMQREQVRLNQVKMLAPMSGLVSIKENRAGFSGFMGTAVPDIREGDQVQPGIPVAEILDLSELEILARVGELDRANLQDGQDVVIRLDALPDQKFSGKVKSMSGTARANVFSSDPAKKFDVIFSIDMRQLLSALGAKKDQVERIMRTAAENRTKAPVASAAPAFASFPNAGGMTGGMAGGMPPQMMAQLGGENGGQGDQQGGAAQGQERQRRAGGRGGAMFAGLSEQDRAKVNAEMQKILKGRSMRDLTPEERTDMFKKLQAVVPGVRVPGQNGRGGGAAGTGGAGGSAGQAAGAPGGMNVGFTAPGAMRFTKEQMDSAKLPPPPEDDTELNVLLRPGLLADIEIIVEKIPNAIHIPSQAVFEKEGKPIVFLKVGNLYEERPIRIAKQSESTTIIASGLKANDVIALVNPEAKPGEKKSAGGKSDSGNPVKGMGSKGGQ